MRVGIYQGMPAFAGGGFQYEMVMLDALAELAPSLGHEMICTVAPNDNMRNLLTMGRMTYAGLPVRMLGEATFQQAPLERYLEDDRPPGPAPNPSAIYVNRAFAQSFRAQGIDWLLQLQPSPIGFSSLMPFVMPIHDLQHRLQPEFPEVSQDNQIPIREYMYQNVCRYATLVLVESEHGKSDVLSLYGNLIDEDRIRVLPLFPPLRQGKQPTEANIRHVEQKYGLPERYFFYPAQMWRHKNHRLIIEAQKLIAERTGMRIPLVLSGSYAEKWRARNFKELMELVQAYGLEDCVKYLGFVPDEDMPALYTRAVSLVMPTFFGPSNIPALESWSYGRPAITTDIPGIREQVGDGGILVDPRDPEALARAMLALWNDEALCRQLAENGARRLASYKWSDFVAQVGEIIVEASERVRTGRTPRYPSPQPQR